MDFKTIFQIRTRSLRQLRSWLVNQPHLSAMEKRNDKFLLRFLRSQKFDVPRTEKVLEKYMAMRTENPEWFIQLDPKAPELVKLVRKLGRIESGSNKRLVYYPKYSKLNQFYLQRQRRSTLDDIIGAKLNYLGCCEILVRMGFCWVNKCNSQH